MIALRTPAEVLVALEQECLLVDKALSAKNWADCETSWQTQRRLTHELELSLSAAGMSGKEAGAMGKRIERLKRYRDGQLRKLISFNAAIAKKLGTMQQFREFSKNIPDETPSSLIDSTH
jgi:hypothetical protein